MHESKYQPNQAVWWLRLGYAKCDYCQSQLKPTVWYVSGPHVILAVTVTAYPSHSTTHYTLEPIEGEANMFRFNLEDAVLAETFDHAQREVDRRNRVTNKPQQEADFAPPVNSSEFRHIFVVVPGNSYCAQCGGGKLHAIHQGGTHARS